MDERKINVEGMTCSSCEQKVTAAFKRLPGIKQVSASYQTGYVYIQGKNLPEDPQLEKVIAPLGYHVVKATFPWKFVALLSFGMIVYFGVSILYGRLLFDPTQEVFSFNLIIAYGLVSSLHCIGMCGSIAMGTVLNRKGIKPLNGMWSYQAGRLISYTASGLILGALGEVFTISTGFKNALLLFAGIWMLALALQMAGILKVKLPSFTFKTKNKPYGSFIVGLLNALMPCGSLQTMQIIALTTTNMWLGGSVMLVFGLTTAPSLMMMQWFATRLSAIKGQSIKLISALIVAMMGFQIILQSPFVYQPVMALIGNVSNSDQAPVIDGVQVIHLKIVNGQYKLDANTVKVNQAVKIIFDGYENSLGCANPLILTWSNQKIDILKNPEPIIFTPTKTGRLEIHCWMNMVRTFLKVIE
ncbi:MAG: heavy metal-associated domain-containing protein [Erysipelotrichaceae bacterium]|nr:MAG: heavy metal-associated domain-containing [Erysipelotrichaceae bacterium]TXT18761.1 MAG: heavy metal-associated domain-containing protein [Erysipelotrichaceae bacterium]